MSVLDVPSTLAKTCVDNWSASPWLPVKAFTGNQGDADQLSTQVFAKVEGTSKTDNGYMLEVEDYGSIDPSQVVRFKNNEISPLSQSDGSVRDFINSKI